MLIPKSHYAFILLMIIFLLSSSLSGELLTTYKGTLTPPSDEEWPIRWAA